MVNETCCFMCNYCTPNSDNQNPFLSSFSSVKWSLFVTGIISGPSLIKKNPTTSEVKVG